MSKDGTIAYGSVSWDVVPASLDEDYLDHLDDAVEPARDGRPHGRVRRRRRADRPGTRRHAVRGDRARRWPWCCC